MTRQSHFGKELFWAGVALALLIAVPYLTSSRIALDLSISNASPAA